MSKCASLDCEFSPAAGSGLCYFHSRGMKPPLSGGNAPQMAPEHVRVHQARLREEAARHAGLRYSGKRSAMPAPTLAEDWRGVLSKTEAPWMGVYIDTTQEALTTLGEFSVVPRHNGGVELIASRDGYEISIYIAPDGKVSGVAVGHND